jgi:hypothetical protein
LKFTYKGLRESTPEDPADNFKEVLVLHPNWQGKMHGIDLKRLTPAEREVLDTIMDPAQRGKTHRIPLVNDILRRMNPVEDIKNPMSFYSKFVKVFLRNKDAYRTYYPHHMLHVVISKQTSVTGKVINPKPLFHKVESKPQAPDRLAAIKARAEALKSGGKPSTAAKPPGVRTSKEPARPKVDRGSLIKQRAELMKAKRPK